MQKVVPLQVGEIWLTAAVDGEEAALIDSGYPGDGAAVEEALLKQRITPEMLRMIIITHHDWDHIGGLVEVLNRAPQAKAYSSPTQVPYISGEKRSLRLAEGEADPVMEHTSAVETIVPGTVVPFCGGMEILDTTGHMPGHISVYFHKDKTLAAGDAFVLMDGHLRANPLYTMSISGAVASAQRLLAYDISRVVCYHGGVYEGNVKAAIEEMIEVQGRSLM